MSAIGCTAWVVKTPGDSPSLWYSEPKTASQAMTNRAAAIRQASASHASAPRACARGAALSPPAARDWPARPIPIAGRASSESRSAKVSEVPPPLAAVASCATKPAPQSSAATANHR